MKEVQIKLDPVEYETARPFKRVVTESIAYQYIKEVIYTKDIIEGMVQFWQYVF